MLISLIVNVGVSFNAFLLIISYCHVRIQLAENLCLFYDNMAPSTLGPTVLMEDNPPLVNEICSMRLPIDMSLGDITNSITWTGTGGQGLGHPHFCIVLRVVGSEDESQFTLKLFVLCSFGVGGRAKAE